jgi:hypothetical protein
MYTDFENVGIANITIGFAAKINTISEDNMDYGIVTMINNRVFDLGLITEDAANTRDRGTI